MSKPTVIEAHEFPALLRPGMTVFVGSSSNEPTVLVEALAAAPEHAGGVRFIQFPLPGLNTTDFSALAEGAEQVTFFMSPALRDGSAAGRVKFLPMQMRFVFDYLRGAELDIALVQVAYDSEGTLRLGPNADFFGAVAESAGMLVAVLNRRIVAPAGAPRVLPGSIDYLVEGESDALTMAPPEIDAAADAIGRHVAALIRDGDCIQTGIGAIPAAILAALGDKSDLGLHGGLIDDGGMRLIQRGNVTGANKTIDRGVHVTGMGLGSRALFEFLAETPTVTLCGANYTHELSVIRRLDNFVSINSAVEVDLHGQINAEVAGGRQISGTGGSVDFMRSARVSKGGRSIIAMNATARGGTVSRIVPAVEMVTALRTDADLVVTEFGVADLKTRTADARAAALIEIAHPDFRDSLREAAASRPG